MKTMKVLAICAIAFLSISSSKAEESKVAVTTGADLVSSYIWRGVYFAGASLQPTLNLTYGGLSVGLWGSSDITNVTEPGYKECDASLFYTVAGVKVGLTQYWWTGKNKPYIGRDDIGSGHYFEGTIGYSISSFNIVANTMFAGDRDKDAAGKQMFSTYIEGSYGFNVGDIALLPAIGVSPWESNSNVGYHWNPGKYDATTKLLTGVNETGFALCNVSIKATKALKFSETLSIPVSVQAIYSNSADQIHLVLGVTL
jgi:hypothetical protein